MLSHQDLLELLDKDDYSIIVPHLYVSDYSFATCIKSILKHNIKCIISITNDNTPKQIVELYNQNNVNYHQILITDTENSDISKYFDYTFNIIDNFINKGENILVHCMLGMSRSPTI